MTTSPRTTSIVSLESALAGEESAFFQQILRDEGLLPDVDPEINPKTSGISFMELGGDTFVAPVWLDRTLRFFELTKKEGLLKEARALWLRLGMPIIDESCEKFREMISWFVNAVREKQTAKEIIPGPQWLRRVDYSPAGT